MREPDVEPLREVGGETVVAVREHHLVAVDGVVIEPVRGEVFDPGAVLLLGAVLQVLAHALRAFRLPALAGDRLVRDVAVRGVGGRGRDDFAQSFVGSVDVVDEGLGGGIRESFTVRTVVGDRAAVGLVAADGELDHGHAECLGRGGDGGIGDAVDPGCAEIGGETVAAVGDDSAAHAVAGLEHQDGSAGSRQQAGRGQACDPRADHDRVVMIHC